MNKKLYTMTPRTTSEPQETDITSNTLDTFTEHMSHVGENISDGIDKAIQTVETIAQESVEKPINSLRSVSRGLKKTVTKPLSMLERKIEQATTEFNDSLPIIAQAGFKLTSLEIELAAIPKLIPSFELVNELSNEAQEKILKDSSLPRMTRLVLETLFKTEFLASLSIGNLHFRQVEIHLGAIPKAKVKFI